MNRVDRARAALVSWRRLRLLPWTLLTLALVWFIVEVVRGDVLRIFGDGPDFTFPGLLFVAVVGDNLIRWRIRRAQVQLQQAEQEDAFY